MKRVLLLYNDMPQDALDMMHREVEVIGPIPAHGPWREMLPEADGIITNVQYKFTPDVLDLATRVRAIGRPGIGVDNINVPAATSRNILVINTPDGPTIPVVEITIGWMIGLAHRMFWWDAVARTEAWRGRPALIGMDLRGKTVGIVGIGRIGSRVATICRQALGMRVISYDPYVNPARSQELGIEWVDRLSDLLPVVDILSLHCPLTDETHGMIGEAQLRAMKPSAYLLNTARGPVTVEADVARALAEGWIAGAAVDVYEVEPLRQDHPFIGLDNISLAPHTASFTREGMYRMTMGCTEQVLMALRDECPPHLVNPEVWPRRR
jgi:D-3-phosphoglycerate dehydrogenase / 2-oxoglutarate reductase